MNERFGRGRHPRAEMTAAHALAVLDHLHRRGIRAWLDGGWGVDALLGRQTRAHDDLDVTVLVAQFPDLVSALAELGYRETRGMPPSSVEFVDAHGHQVDVHPVSFRPTGEAVYRMENGENWVYEAGALSGRGTISGREVRCPTPETMLLAHSTGYELDAAHRADVDALRARYGLPLPEP